MVKALKKFKYYTLVTFNNEEFEIENEVIIKYQISVGKTFTNDEFIEIIKDNQYYYFDRISKNKLRRMLTVFELKTILIENDAPNDVINKLIDKYIKYNYLNDEDYAKMFIDLRKNREGPKILYKKLIDKGVSKEIINKELDLIDEKECINTFVESRLKRFKNKTKKTIQQNLIKSLVNKGFNYNLSKDIVSLKVSKINIDDSLFIEKEFDKLYKRHHNKKDAYELKQYIRQKLFEKGYKTEVINTIISKKLDSL